MVASYYRRLRFCFVLLSAVTVFVSGCANPFQKEAEPEPLTTTGFAFNTTYTVTLYEGGSDEILKEVVSLCAEYERIFSRTLEDSELCRLNAVSDAYRQVVDENPALRERWSEETVVYSKKEKKQIEDEMQQILPQDFDVDYRIDAERGVLSVAVSTKLYDLIESGLSYCRLSEGLFDITIEPVSSLWNFTEESPVVPDAVKIQKALDDVGYERVQLEEQHLEIFRPGTGIDLGGIAKGYIADCIKQYLEDAGVSSGLISLGGNILCIGRKPDGEPFHVGIQQPFADRNETVTAVSVEDVSVVSSGIYERCFETEDGTLYHHLLSPQTGYPFDNGVVAVTIVSEKSVDGDGLSTTCFALGLERGLALIDTMQDTFAVFITADGELHYSEGFEQMLYKG